MVHTRFDRALRQEIAWPIAGLSVDITRRKPGHVRRHFLPEQPFYPALNGDNLR